MFKKILIANRGEIAVRIIRTCQEIGIETVALYEAPDRGSLHVRMATESVRLESPAGFMDRDAILRLARRKGIDAIHPGYGFVAEETDFVRACEAAGIAFIGPPSDGVARVRHKTEALERARAAGFTTTQHSVVSFGAEDLNRLRGEADRFGYPLVIKSCSGGRGRGEQLVRTPDGLEEALHRAQAEAQAVYGDRRVYLERAYLRAHQLGVQVLGDQLGHMMHLGEREGSLIYGNQKVVEETPAPCLTRSQREQLWQTAEGLARLFNYQNAGTVEFLMDDAGQFYFTEIKARIQMEHPLTEMVSRVDLVREQIRVAAGEPLTLQQAARPRAGWAMQCRVSAEDPWHGFRPTPGKLQRMRLPSGPEVRVDTYAYSGCDVPALYDPLIAKLVVWAPDREACLARMARALEEFKLVGVPSNLPLIQRILRDPSFRRGQYTTELLRQPFGDDRVPEAYYRDLAVVAAILHGRRNQAVHPSIPDQWMSGWHRGNRRWPQ
jgi:acetyl/propionyl-CoA carboxylase alpha subunit